MRALLELVGTHVVQRCTAVLQRHDLWQSPLSGVRADIEEATRACERWSQAAEELTLGGAGILPA